MSAAPEQDLTIFKDGSIVPDALLDSAAPHLSVITHSQATSPSWLLNSIIENCLVGTAVLVNRDLHVKTPERALVTYVSFTGNQEFVIRNCKKHGLSLENMSNFTFIDCFSELFTKHVTNPLQSKASISKLFDGILKTLHRQNHPKKVVIVEHPEFLLGSTDLAQNDLLHFLRMVEAACGLLFVVSDAYPAAIDFDSVVVDDPTFKITDFLVKLHHTSCLNMNLLPLVTGRAEDVTGCFTISNGAVSTNAPLAEKEYIYFVSKESTVKFYFR